jgi:hypothetical protein
MMGRGWGARAIVMGDAWIIGTLVLKGAIGSSVGLD